MASQHHAHHAIKPNIDEDSDELNKDSANTQAENDVATHKRSKPLMGINTIDHSSPAQRKKRSHRHRERRRKGRRKEDADIQEILLCTFW